MIKRTPAPARLVAALVVTGAALAPGFAAAEVLVGEPQPFVGKDYDIRGDWSVVEEDGRTIIRFDDDFGTKAGPDLKVFLSPTSIGSVDGGSATDGSVLLGALESTKGTQDYVLPEGVELADFESVLVHCETFSVLWGGGAL